MAFTCSQQPFTALRTRVKGCHPLPATSSSPLTAAAPSLSLIPSSRHPHGCPSVCCATSSSTTTEDLASADEFQINTVRWGVGKEQGPRESMEDLIQVVADGRCGFFFATVFDGHAGIASARFLEEHLYEMFSKAVNEHSLGLECALDQRHLGICCPLELHDVFTECYRASDEALLNWLKSQPKEEAESGSTATTALVRSDRVIVANVGDSRAVLCRSGTAVALSTEHRVFGRGAVVESEIERIQAGGGWINDGRVCGILAVSRAFGDADFKSPNLTRLLEKGVADGLWDAAFASSIKFTADPLTSDPDVLEMAINVGEDEFLVVATDGLWDVMSSQEVVTLVRSDLRKGRHPEEAAQRVASFAVKRHTADNAAVIVVDLLGEAGWKARGDGKSEKKGFFGLF